MQHRVEKDIAKRKVLKELVHRVILFEQPLKDSEITYLYCGYIVAVYPDKVVRLWLTHIQKDEEWVELPKKAEWRGPISDKRLEILEVTIEELRKWQRKRRAATDISINQH